MVAKFISFDWPNPEIGWEMADSHLIILFQALQMRSCICNICVLFYRTHRNLHSHTEKAPMTKSHYQVTGYGQVSGICIVQITITQSDAL